MAILIGSSIGERLTGTSSADTIYGMNGNDILIGGGGADVLNGGAGNNTFRYLDLRDLNGDVIRDFATGDHLDLSR